jgi:predicted TIM-barrel enzyme
VGQKVRDAVERGESMEAIVAAGPAAGYESSLGSQSRADQFVQMLVVGFSRQRAER